MNQDNNTEVKDDLLAAFENPDMVAPVQEVPQQAVEATPVQEVAPTPEVPQQAVEATPVQEVVPTPEMPQQAVAAAPVQEVAPTPEVPQQAVEAAPTPEVAPATQPVVEEKINPTQDNPNKKSVDNTDDPHFVKKNVIFIGIIFALIILFIIFLPQIMKLFGSTI